MRFRVRDEQGHGQLSSTKSGMYDDMGTCRIVPSDFHDYGKIDYVISYSQIYDLEGKKTDNHVKPVDHFRIYGKRMEMPSPYVGYSDRCGLIKENFSGPIPTEAIHFRNAFPSFSGRLGEAGARALNSFMTQVPETTSVANFLFEAGEVVELVKQAGVVFGRLIRALKDLNVPLPFRERGPQGGTLSGLRDAHLQWQFGIKPLIKDVWAFCNVFKTTKARIKALKAQNKSRRTLHYHEDISFLDHTPEGYSGGRFYGSGNRPGGTTWAVGYTLTYCKAKFHCSCDVYQDLQGLDGIEGLINGILASLGVFNPAKVLWNAISYSFVVEYFLRVTSLLNLMAAQPYKGTWEVFNSYWSTNSTALVEVGVAFFPGRTDYYLGGVVPVKQYLRGTGIPVDFNLLPSSPTPQQQLLIGELLSQKLRK